MSEELYAGDGLDFEEEDSESGVVTGWDSLTELENQWGKLVENIRDVREENVALLEQLQEQEDLVARLQQEAAAKGEEVAVLQDEKRRTILRIESLLGRFDDLKQ